MRPMSPQPLLQLQLTLFPMNIIVNVIKMPAKESLQNVIINDEMSIVKTKSPNPERINYIQYV